MELAAVVLAAFVLAAAAPALHRVAKNASGWILALLPAGLAFFLGTRLPQIAGGATFTESHAWVPSLGVNVSFHLDGLSALFALLITGIGAFILVYAGGYLKSHHHLGRLYAFLLLFMGSMLGVVLADNIVTLFVFWELTSFSSYLLIGFRHDEPASRRAALQALLVTGGGGLALLAGLLLLGMAGGSFELSALRAAGFDVRGDARYIAILLLVLAGAFTKSAQFPFHFWLPNAMEAPTPVSAYLHSATMVKAGIYLLARLHPHLADTGMWIVIVTGAGAATMLVGAYLALKQSDLKRVLAYSTVSALGTLTLLLGIGSPVAVQAAMVFLLAHALYKGALFQVAGAVDHETGTRVLDDLGGLRRAMPITALAGVLAALSLAGLAPVLSFIGKELVLEALLGAERASIPLIVVFILSSMLLVGVAGIVGIRPFFGTFKATVHTPHEPPVALWLGAIVLAAMGLVMGLAPSLAETRLIGPATNSILGAPAAIDLALFHGFSPALLLSGVALAGGAAVYFEWINVHKVTSPLAPLMRYGPERAYDATLAGLVRLSKWQTRVLQNGYLRFYIIATLLALVAAAAATLVLRGSGTPLALNFDAQAHELILAVLILAAAVLAVSVRSRLGAVIGLGVTGYGIALIFLLFGAPDVAMTQFLFETLAVLLFVLVFYHVPRFARISPRPARIRDAVIALSVGGLMTVLVLAATATQTHEPISSYFAENSYVEAHGRNVVNVILVDFRGLDTLGEITVLAVAAVGVLGILKLTRRPPA